VISEDVYVKWRSETCNLMHILICLTAYRQQARRGTSINTQEKLNTAR